MRRLLLLFTVVPLVELYLLIGLGTQIGFWPTVAGILVTGVLGATLAKREGLRVLRQYQLLVSRGELPPEGMLGPVLVFVGGALLVAPGVLTDIVGLLLLFPPTRKIAARLIRRRMQARVIVRQVEARGQEPSTDAWDRVSQRRADGAGSASRRERLDS